MNGTQPDSKSREQIPSWVHYLLLGGLFTAGFVYEFFSVTSNSSLGVVLILVLLTLLAFLATFLFIWKQKTIRIVRSSILSAILIWGLVLALNLVVYWRNWYQSLFVANTNIFIVLLVILLVYALASAYNVFTLAKQLVVASLSGYLSGTLLAGGILAANYLGFFSFPDLTNNKDSIIINLTLLAIIGICLLPKLFIIYDRRKNKLAISVLLAGSVVIASLLGNTHTLIFLVACALVTTLLHFRKRVLSLQLIVIGCVVLLSVVLRSMDAFGTKLGKLEIPETNIVTSTSVAISALQSSNPLWGQGARPYVETYRQFEPANQTLEFTQDKQFAVSQIWEIAVSFGLLGLVTTLAVLFSILRTAKTLSAKYKTAPLTISYVQVILTVLALGVLMFHIETHFWIITIPVLVILANMTSTNYWRFEKNRLTVVNSFVGVGLIALIAYFIFGAFAFGANQVYGFAYQRLRTGNLASEQVTLDRIELASQLDPYQVRYQLELAPIYTSIFINSLPNDVSNADFAKYKSGITQLINFVNRSVALDNDNYLVWENKLAVLTNLGRKFPDVLNQDNSAAEALANLITLQPVNGTKMLQLADYVSDFNSVLPEQLAKIAYENNVNVPASALNYARLLIAGDNLPEARRVLARTVAVTGIPATSLAEAENLLESIK